MSFPLPINSLQQTIKPKLKSLLSPRSLSKIATKLPLKLNAAILVKTLNMAFKEQINEGEFDFLNKRVLLVEILDANLKVGLGFENNSFLCSHFGSRTIESDVTLSIATGDAISLIQQQVDPDTLFFQRKLKISGDTELAHHIKNTIDTLDPEVIPRFVMTILDSYKRNLLD